MAHRSSVDGNYHDELDDADGDEAATITMLEEVAAGAKVVAASPLASAAAASNRYNPEQHRCLVCYTDLVMVAHTPCHHDEICGLCHLRLRYLHEDFKCPICKAVNEHLVVDHHNKHNSTKNKQFEDYPIWGDDLGTDFVYTAKARMFFPKKYYDNVVHALFGYHCLVKNCPQSLWTVSAAVTATDEQDNDNTSSPELPATLRQLQDHLRTAHRLTLCQLCCDHQRDFVAQLPRYSPSGLQRHYTNRGGHPVCEFCRPTRFYDLTALHSHLHQEHYKCHVCEQHLELPNQFFANYRSLERHFDGKHYLCHDVQCLTARFVVFANELDLRHHERQVHGGSGTHDTKLQIEFRVRRSGGGTNSSTNATGDAPTDADFNYSLDGQAFVPASLPSRHSQTITTAATTAPSSLHPPHVQRTNELRQEAERLRQQQQDNQSFPALGETMATTEDNTNSSQQHQQQQRPNNRLTVGWNEQATLQLRTQRAGVVTPEEFPSLVANNKTNARQKKSANLSSGWSSTPGLNQNTGGGAARASHSRPTMTTLTPLSRNSALRTSQNSNNVTSLAAEHFPALMANGNATQKYAAAQTLAKKTAANNNNNAASLLQAEHFPALSGGGKKPAPKKAPPPPPVANDFPSLSSSTPNRNVSLDDIKATLGTQQYKRLKGFTQEYASGALAPEAYVDHAASVFPMGYADVDFWNIVPVLLQSCPNLRDNEVARQYLHHLQRMRNGARNVEHYQQQQQQQLKQQQQQQTSTWTSSSTNNALLPTGSARSEKPAPTNSWGKTLAGNVTAPRTATTTTAAKQVATKTNKKKGKGNQKNELRALAFGGS